MKKTSIFLVLLLPFAIFAQKADQCLCTEEDFYDDDFLDLFKNTKDEIVAIPNAQSTSYFEVNSYDYQQLAPDVSTIEINVIQETIDDNIEQMVEQGLENTPANRNSSMRKTALKKRKKVMRTQLKFRKKVRKYRGRCPIF